jgi:hypothetical protein
MRILSALGFRMVVKSGVIAPDGPSQKAIEASSCPEKKIKLRDANVFSFPIEAPDLARTGEAGSACDLRLQGLSEVESLAISAQHHSLAGTRQEDLLGSISTVFLLKAEHVSFD